jgi:uncharacterized protein YbaP (TraB family)
MIRTLTILLIALVLSAAPALADPLKAEDEIVVVGERPGPRLWRIDTPAGGEVYILGTQQALPKSFTWKTTQIDAVVARADRVLIGSNTVSVGIGALIANRNAFRNPGGARVSDQLDAATRVRFHAARTAYGYDDGDLEGWRPYVAGLLLLDKAQARAVLSHNLDPQDVTLKKVRKRRIPVEMVTTIQVKPVIHALNAMPLGADAPCLAAELDAVDLVPVMQRRALAWSKGDIDALRTLGDRDDGEACLAGLQAGGVSALRLRETLISDWTTALTGAAARPGVTLAIAPMGLLLAADGVLARLRAQGMVIEGP